jgi:hypothetical protein
VCESTTTTTIMSDEPSMNPGNLKIFNAINDWCIVNNYLDISQLLSDEYLRGDVDQHSIRMRTDFRDSMETLLQFDHDNYQACKDATGDFLTCYGTYFQWAQSDEARGIKVQARHYWFKHFRKLVKQTAFALLMQELSLTIDQLPDEEEELNKDGFHYGRYETQLRVLYKNCMDSWTGDISVYDEADSDDEDSDAALAKAWRTELSKDLASMLAFKKGESSKLVSAPRLFIKLDDNRDDMKPPGVDANGNDSRGFVSRCADFLRETEKASLGQPVLATLLGGDGSGIMSSPALAASGLVRGGTKGTRSRREDATSSSSSSFSSTKAEKAKAAKFEPTLPPKGSKVSSKSISGPRKSAHAISSIEDDENDNGNMQYDDGDGGDDDDDGGGEHQQFDEAGEGPMNRARRATERAANTASVRKKHKGTVQANAGEDDSEEELQKPSSSRKRGRPPATGGSTSSSPEKNLEDRRCKAGAKSRKINMDALEGREVSDTKTPLNRDMRKRVKWTFDEETALADGVRRYATEWARIKTDPEFSTVLKIRTNVDLKDKYRLMVKKGTIDDVGSRPAGWRSNKGVEYQTASSRNPSAKKRAETPQREDE